MRAKPPTATAAAELSALSMKIGSIELKNPSILAPLAGITDLPFRLLAKEAGSGLVYSEMISSHGLVYGSAKTLQMLESLPAEKPLCVQIFGAKPSVMAEAAARVEASGADMLDINFGCSVKKITKTGAGVALMREPRLAEELLKSVRNAVRIPLAIKIRSGWDTDGSQAVAIAEIAESCGVDAVAVHPRTATQGFRGKADWSVIAAVKRSVSIPVIGNGDIVSAGDACTMMDRTGCDAVMIGRAAVGNPWIFSQFLALRGNDALPEITPDERFDGMLAYLNAAVAYRGEEHACRMMRSRLAWFVKGMRHAGLFRESIKRVASKAEAVEAIERYRDFLVVEGKACAEKTLEQ